MSTKADMEKEIDALKVTIRQQQRALDKMSNDKGICISLPWALHGMDLGPLPRDSNHVRLAAIQKIFWDVTIKHGIEMGNVTPGAYPKGTIEHISGDGISGGKRFMVPEMVAVFMAEIINAVGEYADAIQATGYAEGIDHLRQLASGKMTPQEFEDTATRNKSRITQRHKRLRIRIYKDR